MNKTLQNSSPLLLFLSLLLLASFTYAFMKVWDGTKKVDSSERNSAYSSRIDRLNNAEQYALLANTNGFYHCYHCLDQSFYLYKNEVWRYGVTINGKSGRYKDEFFQKHNVSYVVEFEGTLQECLEEEAIKIILYYQLPENARRKAPFRLARPPGNAKDQ